MMAGLAIVAVGHLFDTVVKVKLQKHNTDVQGLRYKNGLHCASRILQTEGVKGLKRGVTSSFLGMTLESSLMFGIYSLAKLLRGTSRDDGPQPEIIVPSTMCAGAIISFVLCPTGLVKVKYPELLLVLYYVELISLMVPWSFRTFVVFFSVECRSRAHILWFLTSLDATVLLIVLFRLLNTKG